MSRLLVQSSEWPSHHSFCADGMQCTEAFNHQHNGSFLSLFYLIHKASRIYRATSVNRASGGVESTPLGSSSQVKIVKPYHPDTRALGSWAITCKLPHECMPPRDEVLAPSGLHVHDVDLLVFADVPA